jgi:hypothetical protein
VVTIPDNSIALQIKKLIITGKGTHSDAEVVVNGNSSFPLYSFQWSDGFGVPTPGQVSSKRTDLPMGFYYVEITDNVTGCRGSADFSIGPDHLPQKDTLSVVVTQQPDCYETMGEIETHTNELIVSENTLARGIYIAHININGRVAHSKVIIQD